MRKKKCIVEWWVGVMLGFVWYLKQTFRYIHKIESEKGHKHICMYICILTYNLMSFGDHFQISTGLLNQALRCGLVLSLKHLIPSIFF